MDFLKNQFDRIQQQLGGSRASQKMLAACAGGHHGHDAAVGGRATPAQPEMEALLGPGAVARRHVGRSRRQLAAQRHPLPGRPADRILVPAERQSRSFAISAFDQAAAAGHDQRVRRDHEADEPVDGQDQRDACSTTTRQETRWRR